MPAVALVKRFTDTHDHAQPRRQRGFGLGAHDGVGLAMIAATLAVSDDDKARTDVGQHRRRDIAGMRAFDGGVAILPPDADGRDFFTQQAEQWKRRRQRDLNTTVALRAPVDGARLGQHGPGAIHLPVAHDIGSMRHKPLLVPEFLSPIPRKRFRRAARSSGIGLFPMRLPNARRDCKMPMG